MNSELVQTGFFDLESVANEAPIQVAYDYSRVTPEQADKLLEIYKRVLVRHMATAYDDGKDLIEARAIQGLPYKEFIAWAKDCYGWGESSVKDKMNIALRWGPITPTVGVIEDRAMYLLSTKTTPEPARQEAKAILDSGRDVDEELARELRDKHKALEEANKRLEAKERELSLFKEDVEYREQTAKQMYTAQVQTLKQQIKELEEKPAPAPEKVTVYEDTPTTKSKVSSLENQIRHLEEKQSRLRQQLIEKEEMFQQTREANSKYAEENKKLSEEAKRRFIEGQIELDQLRVRQEWRKAVEKFLEDVAGFMAKVPALIDREAFESDDWSRYGQCVHVVEQTLSLLKSMQKAQSNQFVDATPIIDIPIAFVEGRLS